MDNCPKKMATVVASFQKIALFLLKSAEYGYSCCSFKDILLFLHNKLGKVIFCSF